MSAFEAAGRWYLVLVACTWALAPLVRWLCAVLPDRGATVARPIALLLAVYPSWLLASLGVVPFGAAPLIATLVIAAAAGWGLLLRQPEPDFGWVRPYAWAEVAGLATFALFVWFRGLNPDILNTEKPMDSAFLSSVIHSSTMPPPDPWMAGESINYYYIGYAIWGTVEPMVIPRLFSAEKFQHATDLYNEYGVAIVFAAGFSPIPYKVFTVAGGVAKINLAAFIGASIVGRSARFFLVAWVVRRFGDSARDFIDRYFNLVTLAFTALLVGAFLLIKVVL